MMMTSTIDCVASRRCPICGRALADTAPEGLCLVCLLEAGLGETSPAEVIESAGPERPGPPHPRYFGDYEILREVGRGGMGVVYEARQFGTQRTVALKLLSAGAFASADAVHRFHTEAQAAARLEHPNIVPVYEAGLHDGQHFLAMRFMPGGTLAQRAQAHPVDPRRAAEIILSLARAIAHAHQHGVLHRDLKPGNILLDENGEPHLADFGLARLAELEGGTTLTSAILGTAPYMPPEQAAGGVGAATTAGDIYGLGAVLYELLTGQAPFTGASVAEILRKVQEEEPATPLMRKAEVRSQRSEVGGLRSVVRGRNSRISDLQTICLKCLEKEPDKRYATALDLADDLERFLKDEPSLARPVTLMERTGRWCRRRPAIAGLSAGLVLAVLAGFAGTLWQLQQARQNAAENLRQIARLHVLNGVNLLQEGDHFRSLLWFAEALTLAADPPERTAVDRLRIASIVAMGPRLAAVITHDQQPVADAAFHPAKDQLATVGRDRRLRLWAVPTGRLLFKTEPFDEPPSHVQFAPDGQRLLVVSSEFSHARLLSASNGEPLAGPIPHLAGGAKNQPLPPRFDEAGKLLLTQSAPNTLQVWSVHDASPLARLIETEAPIVWMNFSADGEQILVRTQDGRTRVGAWRTGNLVELAKTASEALFLREPLPRSGELAFAADISGTRQSAATPREWPGAALDRDHQRLLTFGRDRSARLLDATTGAALLPPIEHPSLVEDAVFSPDGARFATVTAGGRARVWSTDTGEPLMPPIDHSPAGGALEFSASGRFLFTIHPAHAVFVWDLWQTNEPPVLLRSGAPQTLAESGQDGSVFVTRDPNSLIRVRALAGAVEVSLHPSSLKMVPVQAWFDQTGQFVILEGEKQRAQIWHAATGLPVTPVFQSRYTTNDDEWRTVKLPTISKSAIGNPQSETPMFRVPHSAFRPLAELLSGCRLDGTGGWRPLELGEIIARWNQLTGEGSDQPGSRSARQPKPASDHGLDLFHLDRRQGTQAPEEFGGRDGQHTLDIEHAALQETDGHFNFELRPARLGRVRDDLEQGLVASSERNAYHQDRSNLGREPEIGQPDLAAFRGVHGWIPRDPSARIPLPPPKPGPPPSKGRRRRRRESPTCGRGTGFAGPHPRPEVPRGSKAAGPLESRSPCSRPEHKLRAWLRQAVNPSILAQAAAFSQSASFRRMRASRSGASSPRAPILDQFCVRVDRPLLLFHSSQGRGKAHTRPVLIQLILALAQRLYEVQHLLLQFRREGLAPLKNQFRCAHGTTMSHARHSVKRRRVAWLRCGRIPALPALPDVGGQHRCPRNDPDRGQTVLAAHPQLRDALARWLIGFGV